MRRSFSRASPVPASAWSLLSSPAGIAALLWPRSSPAGEKGEGDETKGSFFSKNRSTLLLGAVIMVATWASDFFQKRFERSQTLLREAFYTTLEVRSHQPEFDMLLCWLSEQPIGSTTRNIAIRSGRGTQSGLIDGESDSVDAGALAFKSSDLLITARSKHEGEREAARRALLGEASDSEHEETDLEPSDSLLAVATTTMQRVNDAVIDERESNDLFVPGYGTHRVEFMGRTVWLTREVDTERKAGPPAEDRSPDEIITLTVFSRDRRVVEQLLREARVSAMRQRLDQTTVHFPRWGSEWNVLCRKPKRYLSSVYVPNDVRQVASEITEFVKQRAVYRAMGVPWRRGYMLYGPPGTGKSSFILALAGELNVPVYVLTLDDNINDSKFLHLVNNVPADDGALVVIEDLDTALEGIKGNSSSKKQDGASRAHLSLSGVLNALDGIASSEGRVLLVTSNTAADSLPPALVRPGRIDRVVNFGPMEEPELRRMLRSFGCSKEAIARATESLSGKVTPAKIQAALQLDGLRCKEDTFARLLD